MTEIKFVEKHIDSRVLDAADLKKAGVENFRKTEFKNGEPVEVSEDVAAALLTEPDLFGQFEIVEDGASTLDIEEEATEEKAADKDSTAAVAKKTAKESDSASASTSTGTPSATGTSTGRASTR